VIDEIRELMIRSTEDASEAKHIRREAAAAAKQWKQQQQQRDGAERELQRVIWDPGGFQQPRWRAHQQELMNFSQQRSMMQEHRFKASHVPASSAYTCI
jgi:hypothetical protein